MIRSLALAAAALFIAVGRPAYGGTASLAWDPVPDTGVAGYRVYYGTATGVYTQSVDVGNVTQATVSGLTDCTNYFFAVKAYDTSGNQSASCSNEIQGWSRPVVATVTPFAAELGRTLTLTIAGSNFQTGATALFSGAGITVNSTTVDSCGQLTISVTVANTAAVGASDVSVTNPDGTFGTGTAVFTVAAGTTSSGLVQHASTDAGTITSSSLAFPASNTAGNLIAVVVRVGRSNAIIAVEDSNGNFYWPAAKLDVTVDAPFGDTLAIFYAENAQAGMNTVSVSSSLVGASLRFAILEYAGVARSSSLDGTASAQGSDSTPNSGNATTTSNGDLVLGAVTTADPEALIPDSGFTLQEQVAAKLMAEDRIQTSAGPASAGGTLGASNAWGAVVAAFRAAPPVGQPDLTLVSTHTGTFVQGQSSASYTLTVTNVGSAASIGPVTVTDTVPAGLTATDIDGAGWTCTLATTTCTRVDGLAASGSYPPITLTVSVAGDAASSVTNTASVAGGGELNTDNDTASDITPIGSGTESVPAISLVQHRGLDAGSASSAPLAFATTNTAGNLIVVAIRSVPSGPLTVTDSLGNTYQKATQLNETVDGMAVALYYAENIAGGSNAVTVSKPQSGGTLRFAVFEYAGVALAGSLDQTAGAQGAGAMPNSGTVTPTSNGELVIGVITTANAQTITDGAGYVIEESVPAAPYTKLIVEDQTEATATSLSAGATLSSSDYWAAVVATFRPR